MREITCIKENKNYPDSNFYKINNYSMFGDKAYIPICKGCIAKIAKNYYNGFNDKKFAIYMTCIKLDIGFDEDLYNEVVTDNLGIERATKTYLDTYSKIKKPKYNNADDLLFSSGLLNVIRDYTNTNKSTSIDNIALEWVNYEVSEQDIIFWGKDYSQEEYFFLTNTFDEYFDSYSVDTPASRELLKQICLTTLEIRNIRDEQKQAENESGKLTYNKTIDELTGRLLKILSDNNMKPNQKKNLSDSQESFGTLIEKWEYEEPVPNPFSEWERNNIYKDVGVWIVGHIKKMFGKEKLPEYEEELKKYTVVVEE